MKSENLAESREVTVHDPRELTEILNTDFTVEHLQTTNNQVKLREDSTLEVGNRCWPYTDHVHDQLAASLKISPSFDNSITYRRFCEIHEWRKFDLPCAMTLCISNGTIVGIAKGHYGYGSSKNGVAKTTDVLNAIKVDDVWEFESATVSDSGTKINLLVPGETVEPEEGDILKIGLELSNSETGGRRLMCNLFTLRLFCTNGMTQKTDRTSVYYTEFGNLSYDSKIRAFAKRFEEAKSTALESAVELYEGITEAPILDTDLLSLHRTIKRRVGAKLNVDDVLEISPSVRTEIFNRVRERDRFDRPQPTDLLAWTVHNAITATARDQRLLIRQSLEQIGGQVLFNAQRRRFEFEGRSFSLN